MSITMYTLPKRNSYTVMNMMVFNFIERKITGLLDRFHDWGYYHSRQNTLSHLLLTYFYCHRLNEMHHYWKLKIQSHNILGICHTCFPKVSAALLLTSKRNTARHSGSWGRIIMKSRSVQATQGDLVSTSPHLYQ